MYCITTNPYRPSQLPNFQVNFVDLYSNASSMFHESNKTCVNCIAYSAALLERVPVKHILDHAELSPGFSDIYPDLLCCVANQFPELFDVNAALIAAGSRERTDMESRLTLKKPRRAIHLNVLKEHLHQSAEAARGKHMAMYNRDEWDTYSSDCH
jgi:Integrator complex subunit 2